MPKKQEYPESEEEETFDDEKKQNQDAAMSIRKANYFMTESLGEGSYGAVSTVYNDDGQNFAMKAFQQETEECDDSDDEDYGEDLEYPTLDLGTLREISTLRMFSKIHEEDNENVVEHPGIIKLHDVAVVQGKMSMVMSKMSCNLTTAIKNNILNNKQKLHVAHMFLQTVAFLHKNDVIHRDIKCDNILLDDDMNPVLADFSLAKIFDCKMTGDTHTAGVGTPTYKSPECYKEEPYGLAVDNYAAGVVILELFNGILAFDRDKAAINYIGGVRDKMTDKPIPFLLKGLLDPDPVTRLTAEQALKLPVFENLKLAQPIEKCLNKIVHVDNPNGNNTSPKKGKTKKKLQKKKIKVQANKKQKTSSDDIDKIMAALEFDSPLTKIAAKIYQEKSGVALEDCVVLAGKIYEREQLSVTAVDDYLEDFDFDDYAIEELKIFKAMDYCLFV